MNRPAAVACLGFVLGMVQVGCAGRPATAVASRPVAGPPGAVVLAASLPSSLHEAAVFSDGRYVYAAGGLEYGTLASSRILRFDPVTATVAVLPEALPRPRWCAGWAWTGAALYLFGGLDRAGVVDEIIRYVPGAGDGKLMTARLPHPVYNPTSVWTGQTIYVFGGENGGKWSQILEYDPAGDTVGSANAELPVAVEAAAGFWDGKVIWLLGGNGKGTSTYSKPTDAIQAFDPASGRARVMGRLPYPVWDAPAFSDGKSFYLAGGRLGVQGGYDTVLRFAPDAKATAVLPLALPLRVAGRSATWVSAVGAAFIVGGDDFATAQNSDRIVRLVP